MEMNQSIDRFAATTLWRTLSRRRLIRVTAAVALTAFGGWVADVAVSEAASGSVIDQALPTGHWYSQAGGGNGLGFAVTDPFWTVFSQYGGTAVLGYPVSARFIIGGFIYQATQNSLLQEDPATQEVRLANLYDLLHDLDSKYSLGIEAALQADGVPAEQGDHSNGVWAAAKQERLAWLTDPHIASAYNNPSFATSLTNWDPITYFGLPESQPVDMGAFIAQTFQRVTFIYWKESVQGGQPIGTLNVGNGGDLVKKFGIIPDAALVAYPYGIGGVMSMVAGSYPTFVPASKNSVSASEVHPANALYFPDTKVGNALKKPLSDAARQSRISRQAIAWTVNHFEGGSVEQAIAIFDHASISATGDHVDVFLSTDPNGNGPLDHVSIYPSKDDPVDLTVEGYTKQGYGILITDVPTLLDYLNSSFR